MDTLVYQDSLNPTLKFELKPGAVGKKVWTDVRISRQGLRDDEIPLEKAPDEFRIAVVGDHPAFGLAVPLEDAFVRKVQGLLKVPGYGRPRTINLSMYHYNIEQKIEFLRARGMQFDPDYVVLQVGSQDDVDRNEAKYPYPRLKNFLRSHSHLMRLIMEGSYWRRSAPKPPETAPGNDRFNDNFQVVARLAQQKKVPVLVMFVPDLSLKGNDAVWDATVEERIRKYAAANGLPYFSARDVLRFQRPEELLQHQGYPWLNARAHAAVAEALAKRLQKEIPKLPVIKLKKRNAR